MTIMRRMGNRVVARFACVARHLSTARVPARHTQSQAVGNTAHTLLYPTPSSLTAHLSRFPPSPSNPLLYLLSTSTPSHHLQGLVTTLQAVPGSVGSFSVTPPGSPPTLCLASFASGAKTFRTDITGRPGAEVGRWQRPTALPWEEDRKGSAEGDLPDKGWEDVWRAERGVERIPELEGMPSGGFVLLTDGTPNPLLRSLEVMYPSSSRVGLVTAPTPFVTGRPHTLFHGAQTYSSGSIGIALPSAPQSTDVSYPLKPLTDAISITSARGNMLLRIDGANDNPTQRLITALQARGSSLSKEEDFYLALLDEQGATRKVVKILSGDPSRGALALEMEEPLLAGQAIQFMYRDTSVLLPEPVSQRLTFSALSKYEHPDPDDDSAAVGESRTVDGFLAFGEDGFIVNDSVCSVPSATASWSWSP